MISPSGLMTKPLPVPLSVFTSTTCGRAQAAILSTSMGRPFASSGTFVPGLPADLAPAVPSGFQPSSVFTGPGVGSLQQSVSDTAAATMPPKIMTSATPTAMRALAFALIPGGGGAGELGGMA